MADVGGRWSRWIGFFPISCGGVAWVMVGVFFRAGVLPGTRWRFLGVQGFCGDDTFRFLPTILFLCLVGMTSIWVVDSMSDTGIVGCESMAGDPEPPVGVSLGFRVVNPTVLVTTLTFGLVSGIPSSIDLSYSGGLVFSSTPVYELSVISLTGFEPGLGPFLGLTEGDYVCISFEPGALFDGDCWGTQQKDLLVADSCAQFSPSEVFNDSGAFSKPVVTVDEYFGGVIAPAGLLDALFLLHNFWVLKEMLVGWVGMD
jgi:hypothetical protein